MKLFFTTGMCCMLLAVAGVHAQKGEFAYKEPTPNEMQEGMAKWMEMSKPGKMHSRLAYFEGEWTTTAKVWMDPNNPMESTGEATFTWLFSHRWMKQEYKGTMMGMPMEGFGIHGYDNFRKQFVGTWVDNMGTSVSMTAGNLDGSGETLIEYGTMDDPMTGEVGKMSKHVTRIIDENTFIFEIHDMRIGEEHTMVLEITYKRKDG